MANWNNITSRGDVEDRRSTTATVGGMSVGAIALVALLNYALTGQVNLAKYLQRTKSLFTENHQSILALPTSIDCIPNEMAGRFGPDIHGKNTLDSNKSTGVAFIATHSIAANTLQLYAEGVVHRNIWTDGFSARRVSAFTPINDYWNRWGCERL
jgi:predicted metalloprotease